VTDDDADSDIAAVFVSTNNPPTAAITGITVLTGTGFLVEGNGTDPEDGNLTSTIQVFWEATLTLDPNKIVQATATGALAVLQDLPDAGFEFFDITLTVIDSGGLEDVALAFGVFEVYNLP